MRGGWGSVNLGKIGVWDSLIGDITYRGVSQRVEFNQRGNRTPESLPNRATGSPEDSDGWG